ncbi:MAG TPA: TetR/AcrR family transcriptional regulator [Steroidobacter sp.]|jgi:AcrR family transcriptional regulator|nr:TetR/AcrR family transcriptional regulator [Steroidobacteraceae bacterium]HLS79979.1 TetR/AcrR family transcriptional regulator [Steroidobacter sp.]
MNHPKRPTARELQRQDTFNRVFEAALSEFRRVGVEKATVREICLRAGVAKGTFFFHFPTKDHVLLARQQRISEAMAQRIATELTDAPDAKVFLQRLTAIVLEEHQAVGDLELVRQINLAIVRQGGLPQLGVKHTAMGVALAAQIRRLQRAGVIRSGVDAARLADCLRLSFFGFLLNPQSSFETSRPQLALLTSLLAEALLT